jgi:hypothetical protein
VGAIGSGPRGGKHFVLSRHCHGHIEFLSDFDQGSAGEAGRRGKGKPLASHQARVSVHDQDALTGHGLGDAFPEAFTDPVELGPGTVAEGEDNDAQDPRVVMLSGYERLSEARSCRGKD